MLTLPERKLMPRTLNKIIFMLSCSAANATGVRPPVWGAWSSWGTCSKSCGGGQRTRTRACISSDPDVTVTLANCTSTPGDHIDSENCNTDVCVSKGEQLGRTRLSFLKKKYLTSSSFCCFHTQAHSVFVSVVEANFPKKKKANLVSLYVK